MSYRIITAIRNASAGLCCFCGLKSTYMITYDDFKQCNDCNCECNCKSTTYDDYVCGDCIIVHNIHVGRKFEDADQRVQLLAPICN